jgi:2-polyprenyl-3-methyl-5-hydroxy-6-metoxy-1,4-benzoquinol methylase
MRTNNIPQEYSDHVLSEAEFLEAELKMGIGFHNREFITSCLAVLNNLTKFKDIRKVIDFGAGTGVYSRAAYEIGYQVLAIEKFQSHRDYITRCAPMVPVYSLEQWRESGKTDTDLLLWIETAEHMTDEQIEEVFDWIGTKYVLFSSTSEVSDNDEAWGHINIKTQQEWIALFKSKGFKLIEEPGGPTAWTKIFKKI